MSIKAVIVEFVERLTAHVNSQALERTRATILSSLGVSPKRGPGRPPKAKSAIAAAPAPKKARRKGPIQLCPVPGCKNPAAPVYGMVCAKHKDVAKSKIRKYREARKAKKLKAAA